MTTGKPGIIAAVAKRALLAIAIWAICASLVRADNAPVRVALLGFDFINTSLQPVSAEEKARLRKLDDQLREKLAASNRYVVMSIPPPAGQDRCPGGYPQLQSL